MVYDFSLLVTYQCTKITPFSVDLINSISFAIDLILYCSKLLKIELISDFQVLPGQSLMACSNPVFFFLW